MATKPAETAKLKCLLAEYERLRAEVTDRLRIQKEVERSQIILIGIFAAAVTFVLDSEAYLVLLVASALFFVIGAAFFEQDVNITVLASYIHRKLRPAVLRELSLSSDDSCVLGWEDFRKQFFLPTGVAGVLTFNRSLLTYLPGFLTLIAFLYVKLSTEGLFARWDTVELVLLSLNGVLGVFLLKLGNMVPRLYDEITRP